MDKNAIKKYAVWARNELITRVSQRAEKYDITAEADSNASSVNGVLLSDAEKKQRKALIDQVKQKGLDQVMEEVAYTWFNRFIALRFMEVNGYLPSHIRVFTDDNNNFKPQILAEAIHLELDGLDMEKVYEMKNNNDNDELYKYLIIVQCNELSKILPGMFQRITDHTELLFPDNILREGSVIEQMVTIIPEDDWRDQVQIIGWLYQYYNIEPKAKVFGRPSGTKIKKEEIPAATQLFTPDWIVRYMVENSLGKYWNESHFNHQIKTEWKYYLDEAEQLPDVNAEISDKIKNHSSFKPEEIKCIDPCSGSGHICAYMFDVLIQIYGSYGISERDAVASIVKNNIFGLDIDERAAQLAYFSVMMKARQYDRRFFSKNIQPNVYVVPESNNLDKFALDYFCDGNQEIEKELTIVIENMKDAKEYGSIIDVPDFDFELLHRRIEEVRNDININKQYILEVLSPLITVAKMLSQKYDVAITNPPYMSISSGNQKLASYVDKHYKEEKQDLYTVFITRLHNMIKDYGYQAMITQHSWMFLGSFEKCRKKIILNDIISVVHLGTRAFEEISGEIVQTVAFVIRKSHTRQLKGTYCRLVNANSQDEKEKLFLSKNSRYVTEQANFAKIPGSPVAYWWEPQVYDLFEGELLGDYAAAKVGVQTGDNNLYLRLWHEVNFDSVSLDSFSREMAEDSGKRWFPCNKGGEFRRWYGNNNYLVDWENDGERIRNQKGSYIRNPQFYFNEGMTWSTIASGNISMRFSPKGFMFETKGSECFPNDPKNLYYLLGLMNTKVTQMLLSALSPTLDYHEGPLSKVPVIIDDNIRCEVEKLVEENIAISKSDWDSFEGSWEFKKHPLIRPVHSIEEAYKQWEFECNERFESLRKNEVQLNHLFIKLYGLEKEIDEFVDDVDVSVHKADRNRDIKSFISYAIGCVFGRYSLTKEGLICTSPEIENINYGTFLPDKDNIIPICDDEYFEDDIVGGFVKFVSEVYGKEYLEANLQYVADTLGGKGTAREIIRNYFINNFYADHCNMYSVTGSGKRPIYWLFDSGKKNGFKCLIYMHRYQADTIARIRTDYVHEQQSRYRTAIEETENRLLSAEGSDKVKLNKKLKHLKEQDAEIYAYEEKIHHLADQMISIDLDDGVKTNYAKFQDVLARIK